MKSASSVVRICALLAILALLSVLVTACGDSGSSSTTDTSNSGSTESSEATGSDNGESDEQVLTRLLDEGTETNPPSQSPPPAKGKSVWWVSCGQQIQDCSVPAAAAEEAAKKLGIDFNIADGKLNVGGGNLEAFRTAIAAKPDMIVLHAIPCEVVVPALREAKADGIPVMDVEAPDCSETLEGGPTLITAPMKYSSKAVSTAEYFEAWGQITAEYLAAVTGGETKYIYNKGLASNVLLVDKGFQASIAKCTGCEMLANVEFSIPDLVPNGPWIQSFRSALIKSPEAETAVLPYDTLLAASGGVQAVQEIDPAIKVYGGSGQSMQLTREGKVAAQPAAHSPIWIGWAAMDNTNRVLNGEETVPQGVGFRVVTAEANMPPEGELYESPIDFKKQYEKIWSATE